jgi:hypothetical protein
MPHPPHSYPFYHPNNIWWVQIKMLHLLTLSLSGPNILLSILFSNTHSICSSLSVSDHDSHPQNKGNIIVLYISFFILLDRKWKTKRLCKWKQAFPDFNLLLISSLIEFWFTRVIPKNLNCSTLLKELLTMSIFWLQTAFWSWHMTTYFDLSAFTSIPFSLLTTSKSICFAL